MPDRSSRVSLVLAVMLVVSLWLTGRSAQADDKRGVAVVELFTSEGCSSCPPAEAAVADLIKFDAGRPVFVLAFHVDYWDHLGWRDAFGSAAFSDRQRDYARAFGLRSIYTPQAIVNGRREFVGSDRGKLRKAVDDALATPVAGSLTAKAVIDKNAVRVELRGSGLDEGTSMCVALVQRSVTSKVGRGENGGRTLTHANVVRAFARVKPDASGVASATIDLPEGSKTADLDLIAYAQRAGDSQVVAATTVTLP